MTDQTSNKGNMIFHVPFRLNPEATSASGIRPVQMLKAFNEIGYTVDIVDGTSAQRKKAIKQVKDKIRNGKQYDFTYSECSTMPTLLTDPHHLPLAPFVDFSFFSFLRKHTIPIGLFYRDIYWLFEEYKESIPLWKVYFAKIFYRYDLFKYRSLLNIIYLPSRKMAEHIPIIDTRICEPLPPGHTGLVAAKRDLAPNRLNLLYIGGLGPNYKMHDLFKALEDCPDIHLTLCTRETEWLAVKDEYCPDTIPDNIHIVHKSGAALVDLYMKTDIALLLVSPMIWRDFAAPVKLYEYIGYGTPVISSEGTLVGNFVEDNKIGWTIPYDVSSIKELLTKLQRDKSLIEPETEAIRTIAAKHSWQTRARKVAHDLKELP